MTIEYIRVDLLLPSAESLGPSDVPSSHTAGMVIDEMVEAFQLPRRQSGHAVGYRLRSKEHGRELNRHEVLSDIPILNGDVLSLSMDSPAGGLGSSAEVSGSQGRSQIIDVPARSESPIQSAIRIPISGVGIKLDELAAVKAEALLNNETALTMTLHSLRTELARREGVEGELIAAREEAQQLKLYLRDKDVATILFLLGNVLIGFGTNLVTSDSRGGWFVFGSGLAVTAGALLLPLAERMRSKRIRSDGA